MPSYRTVLVGTDGSETSFRAVEKAGALAADAQARLVVVTAFHPDRDVDVARAQDELGAEAYQVVGSAPAEDTVSRARDRAVKAGARDVVTQVREGDPAKVLQRAVEETQADLLVVGNRGLNTIAGRLLGSVPAEVARRSKVDVLIVHTT